MVKNYKKALKHFKKVDPVLHQAAIKYDPADMFDTYKGTNYFERLCRSITGQQLSTKAAATIWGRFADLFPNKSVTPEQVKKVPHEKMRGAGLSNAKASYVKGIAEAVMEGKVDFDSLDRLSDNEVLETLIRLKGVGQWTVEMFLMFTLHREDLFSAGDVGLRRAMEKLYGLKNPTNEQLIRKAKKWSPYRTYACRILWESLDNNPEI